MKKNNKGFTLIELLAVISLLAIIGIVVTITVVSSYRKSKDKSEEVFKSQLIKGFNTYVTLNMDSLDFASYNEKYLRTKVGFKEIMNTGIYKESELLNPKTETKCESGSVEIYKTLRNKYCFKTIELNCIDKQINTCSSFKVDLVSNTLKNPIEMGFGSYDIVDNTENIDTEFSTSNKSPSANTNYNVDGLIKIEYENNGNTETTWVYSGAVENNYISFAGSLWRVVRINSDGSLRIISEGNLCGNSTWNNTSGEKAAGYTYLLDGVETNSTIKSKLDSCYESKLKDYDKYIVNQTFCNEVKKDYSDSNSTYFLAGARWNLPKKKNADFQCYSMFSDNNYGGEYNLKIGLLTMEEARYASIASNSYLYNSTRWWLMTPLKIYGQWNSAIMFYVDNNGKINSGGTTSSYGVRPVINLRSDITFSKGDGTKDNPYVVKVD